MNVITIELCAEDRARIDRLTGALEARVRQVQYCLDNDLVDVGEPEKQTEDDVAKAAREALKNAQPTEAPKNAQDAPKASDHPTLDPFPEAPTAKAEASEASTRSVSAAELQHRVIELCRVGKKDKVREIVSTYGVQTVAAIPEDKRTEVYDKLKALGG